MDDLLSFSSTQVMRKCRKEAQPSLSGLRKDAYTQNISRFYGILIKAITELLELNEGNFSLLGNTGMNPRPPDDLCVLQEKPQNRTSPLPFDLTYKNTHWISIQTCPQILG